jgi:hypothetical protein
VLPIFSTRLIRVTDIPDISHIYVNAVGSDTQPVVSVALQVILLKSKPSIFPNRVFLKLCLISYTYYINHSFKRIQPQANSSAATFMLESLLFHSASIKKSRYFGGKKYVSDYTFI